MRYKTSLKRRRNAQYWRKVRLGDDVASGDMSLRGYKRSRWHIRRYPYSNRNPYW